MKKAIYFFCYDLEQDPVAKHIYDKLINGNEVMDTNITFDGKTVVAISNSNGEYYLVKTNEVLSHNYGKYLPELNRHFGDFDFAGVINWHEGDNAPQQVMTIHSTGEVVDGVWGKAYAKLMRNYLVALDKNKVKHNLNDWLVNTEATHWAGTMYNTESSKITEYSVPIVDIEIGSCPDSWSNPDAHACVADSLLSVFDESQEVFSLLCFGGVHFEQSFTDGVILFQDLQKPLAISHILPNQWLVSGQYESKQELTNNLAESIQEGVDGVVFHEKLKSDYKNIAKSLAEQLGVPAFKHKKLRDKEFIKELTNT